MNILFGVQLTMEQNREASPYNVTKGKKIFKPQPALRFRG